MKHKSEKFKEFHNEVHNQLGKIIKALRSDRGGKFQKSSKKLWNSFTTNPGWNTTIKWCVSAAEADLIRYGSFNDEFSRSSYFILGLCIPNSDSCLNRTPSKAVDKTPYELRI